MAKAGRPKREEWYSHAVKKIAVRRMWQFYPDIDAKTIAAICRVAVQSVYNWCHFIERNESEDPEAIRLAFVNEAPDPKSAERLWHEAWEKSFHISIPGTFASLIQSTAQLRALYAITVPTTPKQDSAQ